MSNEPEPLKVNTRGVALLSNPLTNKGTAFTIDERDDLGLHGLVPTNVETLEQRADRVRAQLALETTDLGRHMLLRGVQDYDETLFLRVILDDIVDLMPIVYTPVVGEACQKFSQIYQHHRGLFLSYPDIDRMEEMLRSVPHDEVAVIVVTDGERILGLGDQGSDGLGIPIGKLSLYSACGGIDPATTLPIVLDVGTNNTDRRDDPDYLGWRHERIVGPDYDAFIEAFVQAVMRVFPDVMLQWEDFAEHHAHLLLDRYRDRLCTFNDDIQGTATVALAAVVSGLRQSGRALSEQRVVIVGAGSAGSGIAEQIVAAMVADGLSEADARSRFYLVDRVGLLTDDMDGLLTFQTPLAQRHDVVADWTRAEEGTTSLVDVIENAHPSVLIGVTGVFGLFTEEVVRAMAAHNEQPIIMPLSNPTSRAEATASDVLAWSEGRALVATGSPFHPVELDGVTYTIAQSNNSYIFPGVGLGVRASKATRVTDEMFMVAAHALANASDARELGDSLLPPLSEVRAVSRKIAVAVGAEAQRQGVAPETTPEELDAAVEATMWRAEYRPFTS
ncbi:NAD-dependent malic enzyme [Ilumatobacter sp.]|uniref:NAD-dependent malic enzyme n=1 Tax=Ilumatobacter sp. TaxID=1967498 RepID=UPI003C552051